MERIESTSRPRHDRSSILAIVLWIEQRQQRHQYIENDHRKQTVAPISIKEDRLGVEDHG